MQALDSISTAFLAQEWQTLLAGVRVQKLVQPSPWDLQLSLRWGNATQESPWHEASLVFCIHPEGAYAALCPAGEAPPCLAQLHPEAETANKKPGGFLMVLRKHLQGARLERVEALPGEPVLHLHFHYRNELGFGQHKILVAELMGKYSNLLLLDGETQSILGLAHSVSEGMSSKRLLGVGKPYEAPPRPLEKPLYTALSQDLESLETTDETDEVAESAIWAQRVRATYWGFSKNLLEELRPKLPQSSQQTWLAALADLSNANRQSEHFKPGLGKQISYYTLKASPENEETPSSALHEAVGSYYLSQWRLWLFSKLKQRLQQSLNERLLPCQKEVHRLEASMKKPAGKALPLKHWADVLITAYASKTLPEAIPKTGAITLEDPLLGGELVIPVDPARTWSGNAQTYYRLEKKHAEKQRQQSLRYEKFMLKLRFYQELETLLKQAESMEHLSLLSLEWRHLWADSAQLERKLAAGKGSKAKRLAKPAKAKKSKQSNEAQKGWDGILKLESVDGWPLWVGRSSKANANLCGALAHKRDLWLHVVDTASAHVLIKTQAMGGQAIPATTLEQAAQLAIYYSAARENTLATVAYTEACHVKKIPGSWPGHVTYSHEQTLHMPPPSPATVTQWQEKTQY